MENDLDKLRELITIINDRCEKNMNDIMKVSEVLESLSNMTPTDILPSDDTTTSIKEIQCDDILADDTDLFQRRIELHKSLGTYEEPIIQKETPQKIAKHPVLNALYKLSDNEQNQLLKKLFKDACFNVEKITQIKKTDSSYQIEVMKESDRLLNIWLESNQKKMN